MLPAPAFHSYGKNTEKPLANADVDGDTVRRSQLQKRGGGSLKRWTHRGRHDIGVVTDQAFRMMIENAYASVRIGVTADARRRMRRSRPRVRKACSCPRSLNRQ